MHWLSEESQVKLRSYRVVNFWIACMYHNHISEYSYIINICIMVLKYELVLFKKSVVGVTLQQLQVSILPIRPAFVNTLFPVTRPHHIYSTALVIIILIDNLKYVIIFVYVWFLPWKIPEVSKNASRCPNKQKLR